MSKWFEVVVTLQQVYTVKAESEDEALDEVCVCVDTEFLTQIDCKPLDTPEEVQRSIRHGYRVIEVDHG